jgi:hypothetical protein
MINHRDISIYFYFFGGVVWESNQSANVIGALVTIGYEGGISPAQTVELSADNRVVPGSNPGTVWTRSTSLKLRYSTP